MQLEIGLLFNSVSETILLVLSSSSTELKLEKNSTACSAKPVIFSKASESQS